MVLELAPLSDLRKLLNENKLPSWGVKKKIALDIAKGMKFLHERNILHRDLRSPNIFVCLLTSATLLTYLTDLFS